MKLVEFFLSKYVSLLSLSYRFSCSSPSSSSYFSPTLEWLTSWLVAQTSSSQSTLSPNCLVAIRTRARQQPFLLPSVENLSLSSSFSLKLYLAVFIVCATIHSASLTWMRITLLICSLCAPTNAKREFWWIYITIVDRSWIEVEVEAEVGVGVKVERNKKSWLRATCYSWWLSGICVPMLSSWRAFSRESERLSVGVLRCVALRCLLLSYAVRKRLQSSSSSIRSFSQPSSHFIGLSVAGWTRETLLSRIGHQIGQFRKRLLPINLVYSDRKLGLERNRL